jgi:hypothetical protein
MAGGEPLRTRFSFEARPILEWLARIRQMGVTAPVPDRVAGAHSVWGAAVAPDSPGPH